jgi:integrase/recombinase XerC
MLTIALQKESCYAVDEAYFYRSFDRRGMDFDENAAVAAWLAEEFDLSQSEHTLRNYRNTMNRFRAYLGSEGLTLNPWQGLPEGASDQLRRQALGKFAIKIREFAGRAAQGKAAVASSTQEMRYKVISSFYRFCNRYDLLFCGNPVERIKRPRIRPYEHSRALIIEDVAAAMAAIDRSTIKGCRDYALLAVLFETGRRVSEVLRLRWRDLTERPDGSLEVYFARTKGGKTRRDLLSIETSAAVLAWIRLAYDGKVPKKMAWVWLSLSPRSIQERAPLRYEGVRSLMLERLGTTSVHRARHTWVAAMRRLGAHIEEIQDGLGHASSEATKHYDQAVREVRNPRREELAHLLGITKATSAPEGGA